ncbi:MAG: CoA-binding protein [Bilophila wadsworthia]
MSDLIPLFRPKSVALIGASSDTKKYGYWTAKSLIDNKFQGEIHLISRSGGEILGQPTYPDILSVPGEVDLAIIAIAPKHILPIIEQCVEKGVKTGSSFPPVLAKRVEGKEIERRMLEIAARATCASWAPTAWGCTVRRSA